jgi:hypothetical protein
MQIALYYVDWKQAGYTYRRWVVDEKAEAAEKQRILHTRQGVESITSSILFYEHSKAGVVQLLNAQEARRTLAVDNSAADATRPNTRHDSDSPSESS